MRDLSTAASILGIIANLTVLAKLIYDSVKELALLKAAQK